MSVWRRLYPRPAGSLPGGLVTQWGVGIITILVLAYLTWWIYFGSGGEAGLAPDAETSQAPAGSFTDQMAAQVEVEAQRAQMRRLAAERALRQQRQQDATGGGIAAGRVSVDEARRGAGTSPDSGQPYTEEEWKLRERLRLEALERRTRSLRSSPLAQTYRQVDATAAAESAGQGAEPASPVETGRAEPVAAIGPAADAMDTLAAGLEEEVSAASQANRELLAALRGTPAADAPPAAVPVRDDTAPPRVGAPQDPTGWERIYEGAFLEAALVTQLSGDFPGPVLAVVSVPFYSADRQRVLVPRGTRVIGTAQAVAQQDQSRLAVGFHRLIYPDGRWVSLEFQGLNQAGEGGLKDRVNRHYLSTFAAAGAVGVLSGLTLRGSNPFAGGMEGFRAGAGQGFGQAATRIMQRFLNRLPTITIRAGHRLRIWFTSDVLVPRPD